ncbi:VWA domain-containing protein [Vibrio sp. WXL210]|uniref:VWA domain-containing protein n=1 Tax=Vibrio sp. WXL210 TaxID=3450709 RepID=UPI003EC4B72B
MLTFEYPWAGVLIIGPLFARLLPDYLTKQQAIKHPVYVDLLLWSGLKAMPGSIAVKRAPWQWLGLCALYIALVVAAMKPVMIGEAITTEEYGTELMIAVDLSGSMQAHDFPAGDKLETRIDAVKRLLSEFIRTRDKDRIALVAFGDEAYLQAPFSADLNLIERLLDEMQVRMAGSGTSIGSAIGVAVDHFKSAQTDHKTLILMTDGRDTTSRFPVTDAAHYAAEQGIVIYPIAIGDPTTLGEQEIDIALLERIAQLTNGQVFSAMDSDELAQVYTTISALEPSLFATSTTRPKQQLFYLPAGLALMIIFVLSLPVVAKRYFNRGV